MKVFLSTATAFLARRAARTVPGRLARLHVRRAWRRTGRGARAGWMAGAGVFGMTVLLDQAPNTDRVRVRSYAPHDFVVQVGNDAFERVTDAMADQLLDRTHPDVVRVRRILQRLVRASEVSGVDPRAGEEEGWNWRVAVVDSGAMNACSFAGGPIVVETGLLQCSDEVVTGVLAHEMGHVFQGHHFEQTAGSIIALVLIQLLLVGYMDIGDMIFASWNAEILQYLYELAVELPFSRVAEFEADKVGMHLLMSACEDPHGLAAFFGMDVARQKDLNFDEMVQYLSTHPSSARRLERLTALYNSKEYIEKEKLCLCQDYVKYFHTSMEKAKLSAAARLPQYSANARKRAGQLLGTRE